MIKSELIERLGRRVSYLTEKDVAMCVNELLKQMVDSLLTIKRVEVRNFGNFTLHPRAPRLARNPKTGTTLITPPKYILRFKPGKEMKERIHAARRLPIRDTAETDI